MKPITTFVSYAHRDAADVRKLMDLLERTLTGVRLCVFKLEPTKRSCPANRGGRRSEGALQQAQLGFVFVSPQFLASDFVGAGELPTLLEKGMIVPIELHRVPLDGSVDLRGLEDRQLFRDSKGRAFGECRTANDRREFARELFEKIYKLLRKCA